MKIVFCTGGNSDFWSFFSWCVGVSWLPTATPQAAVLALLPVPMGMETEPCRVSESHPRQPRVSLWQAAWTGLATALLLPSASALGALAWRVAGSTPMGGKGQCGPSWVLLERSGTQPRKGRRGNISAFMRLPTSLYSCAHTDFFQGVMRAGQRQILLWNSVLYHFATAFISHGQNQMVNTF